MAEDAPSLLSAAAEHVPDVVVTDIKMPPNFQLEGIDCAHAIREKHPGTGVVVLSAHDDEAYAIALLGKGQSGLAYLLKDRIAQGDELVRAIREVAAGGSAVDPAIAERLSGRRETGRARPRAPRPDVAGSRVRADGRTPRHDPGGRRPTGHGPVHEAWPPARARAARARSTT